jgi:hypothetical protein
MTHMTLNYFNLLNFEHSKIDLSTDLSLEKCIGGIKKRNGRLPNLDAE